MDSGALPQQGTAFRTQRGGAGIWTPAPNVLVCAVVGHGEVAFVAPILAAFADATKHGQVSAFFDVERLANYESGLRTGLTEGFMAQRSDIAAMYVLVRSGIVSMGVTVASLALGGIVTSVTDRGAFKASLDDCLYERRVAGFSSNVLDALQL